MSCKKMMAAAWFAAAAILATGSMSAARAQAAGRASPWYMHIEGAVDALREQIKRDRPNVAAKVEAEYDEENNNPRIPVPFLDLKVTVGAGQLKDIESLMVTGQDGLLFLHENAGQRYAYHVEITKLPQ